MRGLILYSGSLSKVPRQGGPDVAALAVLAGTAAAGLGGVVHRPVGAGDVRRRSGPAGNRQRQADGRQPSDKIGVETRPGPNGIRLAASPAADDGGVRRLDAAIASSEFEFRWPDNARMSADPWFSSLEISESDWLLRGGRHQAAALV